MREEQQLNLISESLNRFHATILKFTLRATETIELPPFSGSTFRGGFGAMFRHIACPPHCKDVKTCILSSQCAYARIFEGIPQVESYQPVNSGGLPKPFIIHPPITSQAGGSELIKAGDKILFHITLIGFATSYLPYFILTWRELGKEGIGRKRGRFQLEAVEHCTSLDNSNNDDADTDTDTFGQQLIYSSTDELVHNCLETITINKLCSAHPHLQKLIMNDDKSTELARLKIKIVTPLRIKSADKLLSDDLPFEVLIGALLRRLESLSYFYCGGTLNLDYQQLVTKAKDIQVTKKDLKLVKWERYSRRQDRKIPWDGMLGEIEYVGVFYSFLPFLCVGELIGVGNNCAFGLGRVKVYYQE